MLDVLSRQHKVKARYEAMGLGSKDATPEVARSLAAEGRVLCFDEFQVSHKLSSCLAEAKVCTAERVREELKLEAD